MKRYNKRTYLREIENGFRKIHPEAAPYEDADAVEAAMERRPDVESWTPSGVGRAAGIGTNRARDALRYLESAGFIAGSGAGAWRRWSLLGWRRDSARRKQGKRSS